MIVFHTDIGLSHPHFTFELTNDHFTFQTSKMANTPTLRGFATISFFAADHDAARQWYTQLFGVEPYFVVPGYVEFRVGDYQHEFGLIDSRYEVGGPATKPGGAVMYWHVDDVKSMFEKLLSMGATEHQGIINRTEGFVTASVTDPFGNILGIMYNPHYLAVLAARRV